MSVTQSDSPAVPMVADGNAPSGRLPPAPAGQALLILRPRQWLGLGIVLAGLMVLSARCWQALLRTPPLGEALLLGGGAALATALGVLPMLMLRAPRQRAQDTLLGFGAGVMLAATSFSLINPALVAAGVDGPNAWGPALGVGASLLLGAGLLMLIERWLPHERFFSGEGSAGPARMRHVTLFVLAIVLHNVPEGMAIGVAAAGADLAGASALAMGIAIQDVPEGLVVALALLGAGVRRPLAAGLGALSGLVEPVAAVLSAAAVGPFQGLLPWGLAFAAGAMLFVVSHEVIPESHRKGHERWATAGLLLGFVMMMVLDTAIG